MSGITTKQLCELIEVMMINMPLPSLEILLTSPCDSDEEIKLLTKFIVKHYNKDDIIAASKGINIKSLLTC